MLESFASPSGQDEKESSKVKANTGKSLGEALGNAGIQYLKGENCAMNPT